RQIIRFGPRRLVLVGRGENSIFETMQSLAPLDAARAVAPVILDIRDRARLRRLFSSERPDVVFHAAAHKHVHFMEQFPEEAVLAAPGDTFVLEMGDPVRIVQLARDLIELHGLGEDDVRLEFIGQRPGEKLVEELYFGAERPEPTSHEAIRRVRLNGAGAPDLRARIARLATEDEGSLARTIVAGLQDLVPEYAPAANTAVVDEDSPDREGSRS